MVRIRRLGSVLLLAVATGTCGGEAPPRSVGEARQPVVAAPLPEAYCTIPVQGVGDVDTEADYLPHVITCENGGANLQALKAQAIAARSVVYYAMATSGSICDGQGCQVYSCGAAPSDIHYQAVAETSGMYLSYDATLTYAFYVAGDSDTAPPSCVGNGGATEGYVTYNEGKTGGDVEQTTLGFVGPPGFGQNRGCMGQWGARCLENDNGYDYDKILRFYYGADIEILQAQGACITPVDDPPHGSLDEVGCGVVRGWAQDPNSPADPIDVEVWFGGPADDPGATSITVRADRPRDDLCEALGSCDHGFELATPLGLHDGEPHPVHAYGVDGAGMALLEGAPMDLVCKPEPPQGVRRRVEDRAGFEAWGFSTFWHVLRLEPSVLEDIVKGDDLPASPVLAQADDGSPEVWLLDGAWRRHVPDPATMEAWSFDFAAIETRPAAEIEALPQGTDLRPRPVLVAAAGDNGDDAFYLMDDLQFDGSGIFGPGVRAGEGSADDSGCACSAPGGSGGAAGGMPTALLAALVAAARRRRSRART